MGGTSWTWEKGRKGLVGTWEFCIKGENWEGDIVGPEWYWFLLSDLDPWSDVCSGNAIRYDYNRIKQTQRDEEWTIY